MEKVNLMFTEIPGFAVYTVLFEHDGVEKHCKVMGIDYEDAKQNFIRSNENGVSVQILDIWPTPKENLKRSLGKRAVPLRRKSPFYSRY